MRCVNLQGTNIPIYISVHLFYLRETIVPVA